VDGDDDAIVAGSPAFTGKFGSQLINGCDFSVSAGVIRTPVLAIRNTIAVMIPFASIRAAIAIPAMFAAIPVWRVVNDAAGEQTTDGEHQYE